MIFEYSTNRHKHIHTHGRKSSEEVRIFQVIMRFFCYVHTYIHIQIKIKIIIIIIYTER